MPDLPKAVWDMCVEKGCVLDLGSGHEKKNGLETQDWEPGKTTPIRLLSDIALAMSPVDGAEAAEASEEKSLEKARSELCPLTPCNIKWVSLSFLKFLFSKNLELFSKDLWG